MKQFERLKLLKRSEVNKISKESMNFKDLMFRLGYKSSSGALYNQIKNFLENNNYSFKKFNKKMLITVDRDEFFVKDSIVSRSVIKRTILRENLLENKCSECGLKDFWNQKPICLVLDHINGINNDNRISNLRFLCPNCNSQQDTFAGANIKNLRGEVKILNSEVFKSQQLILSQYKDHSSKTYKRYYFSKKELIDVAKKSYSLAEACRFLKMSDNGLKKTYKRYNIDYKKIISKNQLRRKKDLETKVLEIYAETKSIKKTCQKLKIGLIVANRFLKNVKPKPKKVNPQIIKQIKSLSKKGLTNSQISRMVGFSRHTVDWYKGYKD